MKLEPDNEKFARVVEALRPWLPAVVIAGGWAHRLQRLHALAEAPGYLPLITTDVDVVVGSPAPLAEADMRERLLAAEFREEMSGEHQPPITYVAQKLLVLGRRKREDQERDVLYVHDTLQTFAGHLSEVRETWLTKVVPDLHPRRVKEVKARVHDRFAEVTDLIRGAAHIATSIGRPVSPQSLLEACQLGLERIFL